MESLYRTYRPLTFESVVGQQHIVSTLEHAVTEGRLSHAYLFCGPRGTGKTTMARILAKALLCQKAAPAREQGASGCLPDGTCPECKQIAEGTHPDVYELDAASRTGVDNVREEIIGSVNFAPVRGAYKVYIIDEVHMLTTQAFNALLKTLEEPPNHVVFVMCTTDPQKIPETILSRCQRFDFHRISNEDIVGRLRYICEQEGFTYDDEALEVVAKHARGGMRDALSTLEQLSVFGNGEVSLADARALLGEVAGSVLAEFSRAIAERDVATLFALVRAQVDEGNDLMELTRDLVAHLRDVYLVRVAGARPEVVEATPEELTALAEEAELFEGPDRLARTLTVLDDAALEMRSAADTRLVLEIALTRLARPESDLTLEALADRLDRLEARVAAGVPAAPIEPATSRPDAAPVTSPASPEHPAFQTAPASPERPVPQTPSAAASSPSSAAGRPAPGGNHATTHGTAPDSALAQAVPRRNRAVDDAPSPENTDQGELQRRWSEVVRRVTARQASRGGLLQYARARSDDGDTLTVDLPAGSNFAFAMLKREDSQTAINPEIEAVFGPRQVVYVMGGESSTTATPSASPMPASTAVPVASASEMPSAPAAPAPAPTAPAPVMSAPAPAAPAPAVPATVAAVPAPEAASATPAPTQVPAQTASEPVPSAPASAPAAPVPAPAAVAEPAPAASREASASAAQTKAVPASGPAVAASFEPTVPTVPPEPDVATDRQPWEDDVVPYDDAFIASYEEEDDDLPPFDLEDVPEAESFEPPAPAPASSTRGADAASAESTQSEPAQPEQPQPEPAPSEPTQPKSAQPQPAQSEAAPSEPAAPKAHDAEFDAASVFDHEAAPTDTPETAEDAAKLLGDVFGSGVVIRQD